MYKNLQSPNLPLCAGVGLRTPHMSEATSQFLSAGWFEVHAENFMNEGPAAVQLEHIRTRHALSIHGVGLSLGSARGIDENHLQRLQELCLRYEPAMVSEHVSWSVGNGIYLNDLLPLPRDAEALTIVAGNIQRMQDALKRCILIENLSAYVEFTRSTMTEPQFLAELVQRTGCGLLLDINNVYVSACNVGFDAKSYIDSLPGEAIGEIHLAGHAENKTPSGPVLIDNHGSHVSSAVWELYAFATKKFGRRPTLIEWDSELPPFGTLLAEAQWADNVARHAAYGRTDAAPMDQLIMLEPDSEMRGTDLAEWYPSQINTGAYEAIYA